MTKVKAHKISRPALIKEDKFIDSILRPASWPDYIGQEKIKNALSLILAAAKKRNESSDHLLFYGPAGLGKTTLANLVAKELRGNLKIATGPALQKLGDVAALLSNLENQDVLFIDEAHRIPKAVEEMLYPAMESRQCCLTIGKGLASRPISLALYWLSPSVFTIISAPNDKLLSMPFLNASAKPR